MFNAVYLKKKTLTDLKIFNIENIFNLWKCITLLRRSRIKIEMTAFLIKLYIYIENILVYLYKKILVYLYQTNSGYI